LLNATEGFVRGVTGGDEHGRGHQRRSADALAAVDGDILPRFQRGFQSADELDEVRP
jgi:hypothetical protein